KNGPRSGINRLCRSQDSSSPAALAVAKHFELLESGRLRARRRRVFSTALARADCQSVPGDEARDSAAILPVAECDPAIESARPLRAGAFPARVFLRALSEEAARLELQSWP